MTWIPSFFSRENNNCNCPAIQLRIKGNFLIHIGLKPLQHTHMSFIHVIMRFEPE